MGAILNLPRLYVGGHNPDGIVFSSDGQGLRGSLAKCFDIVESLKNVRSDDLYLSLDINDQELRELERKGIGKSQRGAILFEPQSALPWQTSKLVENKFDLAIWMGRPSSPSAEYWPQIWSNDQANGHRSEIPVMLAANKLSFAKGELYSLRRRIVRDLAPLSVWGVGWGSSKSTRLMIYAASLIRHILSTRSVPKITNFDFFFTSIACGWATSKQEVLQAAKYSIVIENSMEYSSEKAFDSIRALNIPIYVGPRGALPIELESLCVFATDTVDSVREGLSYAQDMDYEAWSARALKALGSNMIREQVSEADVFERVVRKVKSWAAQRR